MTPVRDNSVILVSINTYIIIFLGSYGLFDISTCPMMNKTWILSLFILGVRDVITEPIVMTAAWQEPLTGELICFLHDNFKWNSISFMLLYVLCYVGKVKAAHAINNSAKFYYMWVSVGKQFYNQFTKSTILICI